MENEQPTESEEIKVDQEPPQENPENKEEVAPEQNIPVEENKEEVAPEQNIQIEENKEEETLPVPQSEDSNVGTKSEALISTDENDDDDDDIISHYLKRQQKKIEDLEKERKKQIEEEAALEAEKEKAIPEKSKKFVMRALYFLGILTCLANNAIIATINHHQYYLGDTYIPVSIYISCCHGLPPSILSCVFVFVQMNFARKLYIQVCLTIMTSFFFVLPCLFTWGGSMSAKRVEVILVSLIQGCANGVFYYSITFLASIFPKQYIGQMTSGQASAGISVNILQIIITYALKSLPEDKENLVGGWILYPIIMCMNVTAIIITEKLYKNEFFKYKMKRYVAARERESMMAKMNSPTVEGTKKKKMSTAIFKQILHDIWRLTVTGFVTIFLTYSIYPGIIVLFNFFGLDKTAKPATVTLIYKLCDMLGRFSAVKFLYKEKTFHTVTYSRIIIFVLFFVDIYFDNKVKSRAFSIFFLVIMCIYSLTNGMTFATFCMTCPDNVKDQSLRGNVGGFCTFIYGIGSVCAQACSFGLSSLIKFLQKRDKMDLLLIGYE